MRANEIKQAGALIKFVQKSRVYKMYILYKRTVTQLFKNKKGGRKDYFKWVFAKLTFRKTSKAKWLSDFDLLQEAKNIILNGLSGNAASSGFVPKNTPQIFIFSGIPFYDIGGGQRCSQLAKTFNMMGFRVVFIHEFPSYESERLELFIPCCEHYFLNDIMPRDIFGQIEKDALFIFEIPSKNFEIYLDIAKQRGIPTIYEHIDNWDTSLGNLFYNEESFKHFLRDSDYITVTCRELTEKIHEFCDRDDIIYSANAVSTDIFEPAFNYDLPDDFVRGAGKTLIYYGSLWGEWFDWELLCSVAESCKSSSFLIIGDFAGIPDKAAKMPANVHFLGLKKQEELPAYLYYSDIAFLPFKTCEIGKYVSPLKIFEYIAMGKIVLSTSLKDIEGYVNVIVSDDPLDWINAIGKDIKPQNIDEFVAQNNWFQRCNQLLNVSGFDIEIPDISVSVVVLNHNNKKVIFRCLDSLIRYRSRYNYEIILVDNDSTDGSYEQICERYKDGVKAVRNSKNGCSSGRNLGVENAGGDIIVFLDSDQWVTSERWLDIGIYTLFNFSGVGAVGWGAGWFSKKQLFGPIADYLPNRGMYPDTLFRTDVAYLATDGFIIAKELFKEIGGFDEFYDPTCFEDTDLALNILYNGYSLAYCTYMSIKHLPHQTTKSGSPEHFKLMNRNSKYMEQKWKDLDDSLFRCYFDEYERAEAEKNEKKKDKKTRTVKNNIKLI